jgi:NADH-quinone oxidoreductase subunit D
MHHDSPALPPVQAFVDVGGMRLPVEISRLPRSNPYLDVETYEPEADVLALNMGPQHPSTHGVLRLKVWLDGEVCFKCVPYVGYLHRGVEKLLEHRSYVQITPIMDKNDYVSPMTNELAVNMAFEALMGLEVPPRALVLRTILAELQRIASHHLWLGTFCLDMGGALGGGAAVFLYAFRERELILDLFEALTGARFHYNTHCVGGNRHDIPPGWDRQALSTLDVVERRIDEYEAMTLENAIFHARTKGVGILDPLLALECGVAGPVLRGSGVDADLRRDAPYAAYDRVDLVVPVDNAGDAYARYKVRIGEMRESVRVARLLLQDIPEGPICALKPVRTVSAVKPPRGEIYVGIESPRGELGTYLVSDGSDRPYRLKIRPPSLHAASLLPYMCVGATVSDIVVILGSLDPILGEVDR